MGISRCYYLITTIFLLLLVHRSKADCSLGSNSLNRNFTINSWTGNWTFEGFMAGPSSNNSYYLLSSVDDNQCGIICENTSGEKVWAKTYSNGQCSGFVFNGDETKLFFSSANSSFYAIGEVNCTDGTLNQYKGSSEITVNGKIRNHFYLNISGTELIYGAGDITYSSFNLP